MFKRALSVLLSLLILSSFTGCNQLIEIAGKIISEEINTSVSSTPAETPSPEPSELPAEETPEEEVPVEEPVVYPVFAVEDSYEEELLLSYPEFDLYLKGFESDETGYRIILNMKNHTDNRIYFKYNAQSVNNLCIYNSEHENDIAPKGKGDVVIDVNVMKLDEYGITDITKIDVNFVSDTHEDFSDPICQGTITFSPLGPDKVETFTYTPDSDDYLIHEDGEYKIYCTEYRMEAGDLFTQLCVYNPHEDSGNPYENSDIWFNSPWDPDVANMTVNGVPIAYDRYLQGTSVTYEDINIGFVVPAKNTMIIEYVLPSYQLEKIGVKDISDVTCIGIPYSGYGEMYHIYPQSEEAYCQFTLPDNENYSVVYDDDNIKITYLGIRYGVFAPTDDFWVTSHMLDFYVENKSDYFMDVSSGCRVDGNEVLYDAQYILINDDFTVYNGMQVPGYIPSGSGTFVEIPIYDYELMEHLGDAYDPFNTVEIVENFKSGKKYIDNVQIDLGVGTCYHNETDGYVEVEDYFVEIPAFDVDVPTLDLPEDWIA